MSLCSNSPIYLLQLRESLKSALGASNRDFRAPLNDCKTKEEIDFSIKSIGPMDIHIKGWIEIISSKVIRLWNNKIYRLCTLFLHIPTSASFTNSWYEPYALEMSNFLAKVFASSSDLAATATTCKSCQIISPQVKGDLLKWLECEKSPN